MVRDPEVHREVIAQVLDFACTHGYEVRGLDFSPVKGPEGNIEYLTALCRRTAEAGIPDPEKIRETVEAAHEALDRRQ